MENMNGVESSDNALTLRDYLQVLFRQKAVIFTSILVVMGTAFVGLKMQTRMYEASVKMLITAEKQVDSLYYKEKYNSNNIEQTVTQSEIVKSDPVLMRVVAAQALHKRPFDDEKEFASDLRAKVITTRAQFLERRLEGMPDDQRETLRYRMAKDALKAAVRVDPVRDTNMFTITVRDFNPVGAAVLANTISRAYIIFDLQQQFAELKLKYGDKHNKIVYLRENIARMELTLDGQPLDEIEAMGPASVKIIEQASVPIDPVGTSKTLTFLLAAVMSVFLGVMLAFIFEYADQTLKSPRDIDMALDVPCIGSIRKRGWFDAVRLDFTRRRLSAYARSFQTVCDHLYLLCKDKNIKSLLFASTFSSENVPALMANAGNYFSGVLQRRVLLIDADLRLPVLHKIYKTANGAGLAAYLEKKADFKDVLCSVNDSLALIPAGETCLNSILLFESERMTELLTEAKKSFDIVLVRASALRNHKDPSVLVQKVDAFLLVVSEGQVRRQIIQNAYEIMRGKSPQTLGALLVNRTYPIPRWLYERV